MHLTIRAFALGTMVVVSLSCSASSDAAAKPLAAPAAAQPSPLEQPAPSQQVEPIKSPLTAADPSGTAAPAAAASALCIAVCRKAAGLHCASAEDCGTGCQELFSLPACQTVMVSFLECLSKEPLEHWECDSEGHVPGIRDGYCESEQSNVARCIGGAQ